MKAIKCQSRACFGLLGAAKCDLYCKNMLHQQGSLGESTSQSSVMSIKGFSFNFTVNFIGGVTLSWEWSLHRAALLNLPAWFLFSFCTPLHLHQATKRNNNFTTQLYCNHNNPGSEPSFWHSQSVFLTLFFSMLTQTRAHACKTSWCHPGVSF